VFVLIFCADADFSGVPPSAAGLVLFFNLLLVALFLLHCYWYPVPLSCSLLCHFVVTSGPVFIYEYE
jgi:hypothetical protein